jgi:hypothetical protein
MEDRWKRIRNVAKKMGVRVIVKSSSQSGNYYYFETYNKSGRIKKDHIILVNEETKLWSLLHELGHAITIRKMKNKRRKWFAEHLDNYNDKLYVSKSIIKDEELAWKNGERLYKKYIGDVLEQNKNYLLHKAYSLDTYKRAII